MMDLLFKRLAWGDRLAQEERNQIGGLGHLGALLCVYSREK